MAFTLIYTEPVAFTLNYTEPVAFTLIHASYITIYCLLVWGCDWLCIGPWRSFPNCAQFLLWTMHAASVELPCSGVPDVAPWRPSAWPLGPHDPLFDLCWQSLARCLARPHLKQLIKLITACTFGRGNLSLHSYWPCGLTNDKLYTCRCSLRLWIFL